MAQNRSRARKGAAAHTWDARRWGAAAGARRCCLGRGTGAPLLRPPPSTVPAALRQRLHGRRRPPAAEAWGRLRLRGGRQGGAEVKSCEQRGRTRATESQQCTGLAAAAGSQDRQLCKAGGASAARCFHRGIAMHKPAQAAAHTRAHGFSPSRATSHAGAWLGNAKVL